MSTRQYTPGPWHDAIYALYLDYAKLAPRIGLEAVAKRYKISVWKVGVIIAWVVSPSRSGPCPV